MGSVDFHSHNSKMKLFSISALLPLRFNESEIRGLEHNKTARFSWNDQNHFCSDRGELGPLWLYRVWQYLNSYSSTFIVFLCFQLVDVVEASSRSLETFDSYPGGSKFPEPFPTQVPCRWTIRTLHTWVDVFELRSPEHSGSPRSYVMACFSVSLSSGSPRGAAFIKCR